MDNAVTYRVKVLTRNAFLIFRGKKLRTPVICHKVYERELDIIKTQMIKDGLEYEIIEENKIAPEEIPVEPLVIEKQDEDVKVEELYIEEEDKPNTLMEKLLAEEQKVEN